MEGSGSHLDVGRAGEEAALARYAALGYRLLARNWRCPMGELDLVLWRDGTLVVCEVKARRGGGLAPSGGPLSAPFDAVHRRKRRKLRALAEAFLLGGAPSGVPAFERIRFDVASVDLDARGPRVHVFEDAF